MTRFLDAGSERNVLHFMDWERSAGFEVELAVGGSLPTGVLDGVRVHHLRWMTRHIQPARDLLAVREVRSLVRERKFDLVHTHQSKAGIIGRIAARGVAHRIAHTVHMASFGPGYNRAASAVFRSAERRCAAWTDVLVFVGIELQRHYGHEYGGNQLSTMVIRSPVGIESFLATRPWTQSQRRHAKELLGVSGRAPLLLAVGALTARKRYRMMLEKLAPLLMTTETRLAIAGDGPERRSLEAFASRLGVADRVRFLGHVIEVPEVMAAADLIVHTSAVEGVPQVVIQALAAGRPVVATDVIGLREVGGAPITIVPTDGTGLAQRARAQLDRPSPSVGAEELSPWTKDAIDLGIKLFHDRIQAMNEIISTDTATPDV